MIIYAGFLLSRALLLLRQKELVVKLPGEIKDKFI